MRRTARPEFLEDDMEKRQIVARAAGVIVTVGALLGAGNTAQAQEQSRSQGSKAEVRKIEGVWLPIVTIKDCQTDAVITTFPSMDIYVRGGGFIGFGAVRQSDQIGMGAWQHAGGRNYTAQYQFFGYTRSALRTARQTGRCSRCRQRSASMPPERPSPAPRRQT